MLSAIWTAITIIVPLVLFMVAISVLYYFLVVQRWAEKTGYKSDPKAVELQKKNMQPIKDVLDTFDKNVMQVNPEFEKIQGNPNKEQKKLKTGSDIQYADSPPSRDLLTADEEEQGNKTETKAETQDLY